MSGDIFLTVTRQPTGARLVMCRIQPATYLGRAATALARSCAPPGDSKSAAERGIVARATIATTLIEPAAGQYAFCDVLCLGRIATINSDAVFGIGAQGIVGRIYAGVCRWRAGAADRYAATGTRRIGRQNFSFDAHSRHTGAIRIDRRAVRNLVNALARDEAARSGDSVCARVDFRTSTGAFSNNQTR